MVAGGFRRRIGAARVIGGFFGKLPLGAQTAKHLIGGDMVKPERLWPALRHPIAPRRLQHVEGPGDVGFNEIRRPVNRPVHMAFRGKVHHRIGAVGGENPVQRRAVTDVGLFERIKVRFCRIGHVVQTGRVGQRIDVDHFMPARNRQPHHSRADKARAPGYQKFHRLSLRM